MQKTNFSVFSPSRKVHDFSKFNIAIKGISVARMTSVKYLGVYIDEDMKWSEHIKHVYNCIKKFIGIFYKVRTRLPTACLKNLYFATVHPILQYGIELYANTHKTALHDLTVLNNKILRILQFKLNSSDTNELYDSYNTLDVSKLHVLKILNFVYKSFYDHNNLPSVFNNYFVTNCTVHEHNTRSQSYVHLNLINSNYGGRCVKFLGAQLWNYLPFDLRHTSSKFAFNKKNKNLA